MKNKFVLDIADVEQSELGTTIGWGRRGRLSKTSRALDLTGVRLELRHRPTGVVVSVEIPLGHYSRREMIERRKALYKELLAELERKVAAFLRLPGY